MRILFGTDGIRGIAGTELSAELAFKVGNAIARIEKEKRRQYVTEGFQLFVGKDTRVSCDMLCSAVSAGASAAGLRVYDCGVLPTPALAYITRLHHAVGVMISASHNAYEFNGLKIIRDGFKLPDADEEAIEKIVLSGSFDVSTHEGIGRVLDYPQARGEYVRWVLGMYPEGTIGFPDQNPIRIVMDPGNGAAYQVAPEVLRVLGAEVLLVNDEPDGFNINLECGSQHTETLCRKVLDSRADFGIAYDGDADRCIFIDERGKLVDGDKLMAVTALYYRDKGILTGNQVVATVMSNLGLEVFLKENDIGLERTRVGDRYVLEKMLASERVIGGEQSGHVIFLDRSTTGDGLITSLTVLEAAAHFGRSLSKLTERIPEYPQILRNVKVNDRERVMESVEIKEAIEEYENALGDDGRILLRPSGTEPLIRIMLEGKDMDVIRGIAEEIAAMVMRNDA
ncbi:MAG TPA: phosphoglucosamine mutase [Thermotogota bacterium]|nr:phosphoglucosamine mutase [Thermotogota bacterium]HNR64494.1 phosphoglucosamine mutase [Thermotogota bacterium]HNT96449.1 phosphoglucosamine mutase [Thermotogota bacterium]